MHAIERYLPALALGAALALPAWAQSTEAQSTSGQDSSQTDANGWQAGRASSANTQADARLSADSFNSLDTDHDGRISSAEAAASTGLNGRFRSMDRDGDGYVNQQEYADGLRATRTPTSPP